MFMLKNIGKFYNDNKIVKLNNNIICSKENYLKIL